MLIEVRDEAPWQVHSQECKQSVVGRSRVSRCAQNANLWRGTTRLLAPDPRGPPPGKDADLPLKAPLYRVAPLPRQNCLIGWWAVVSNGCRCVVIATSNSNKAGSSLLLHTYIRLWSLIWPYDMERLDDVPTIITSIQSCKPSICEPISLW